MYYYNYNLYNPHNQILFSLNYNYSVPTVIDKSVFYKYSAFATSLYEEANLQKNYHRHNSDFSLYPMAVRYADPYNNVYVIERPPFKVDLDFSTSRSYRNRKVPKAFQGKELWVPWTLALISFKSSTNNNTSFNFDLFFNDSPLTSLEDIVVPAYLPNVSGSGSVCLGQDSLRVSQTISSNSKDIASIYNMAFNNFFAGWNSDLCPTFIITPYIKDIILNRVRNLRYCPKAIKDLSPNTLDYYFFNGGNSRYISKILFTMSSLDLPEVLAYISSVKDSFNQSVHGARTLKKRLDSLYSHSVNTTYHSYYYENDLYAKLGSLFTFTSPNISNFNVLIRDYDPDAPIAANINNPFIISKIYQKFVDNYLNQIDSVPQFTFDYQDISPYTKEINNVIESISS
jgi:hypothetical protein